MVQERRLKTVARLKYGDSLPREVRLPGNYFVMGSNGPVGTHVKANTCGPTIVVGRKGSFGKVRYVPDSVFVIDTAYYIDRSCASSNLRWIYYILTAADLDTVSRDTGVPGLSRELAHNALIPFCNDADQILLVRYLDNAEIRIARAIQAKIALAFLLRERRSSIETELLFGGTWTTSSKAWFGLGAPGWEQLPARALFDEIIERDSVDLPMLSVTISKGVILQSEYMRSSNSKKDQSRSDRSQYKVVQPGDIIYNKMRAWQGAAGVTRHSGIVSPAYVVLRPRPGVDSSYFGHVMRTAQFAREAERWSYGITSDMWSLRPQHFKVIRFLVPSPDEQVDIVRQLSIRTAEIDRAIHSAEREIELLREYRTRLIADVVSGKKDVRFEAANLPDVDPLELAHVLSGASVIESDVDEEVEADAD